MFNSIEIVPSVRVFHEWPWIEERCGLPGLLERLLFSTASAFKIKGTDAGIVLSIGRTTDGNRLALWIMALGGNVGYRPKRNSELMETVLEDVNLIAVNAGCDEIRIEPGDRPDWKSRILPNFGFEPHTVSGKTVMRKVL